MFEVIPPLSKKVSHSDSSWFSLRDYHQIDLESEKVATMDEIEKGKKVYCRCWLSGTFPLCDGTHQVRTSFAYVTWHPEETRSRFW